MTFSLPDTDWVPGVTKTWTQCPHGVEIMTGTYQRPQVPTGEHPECLAVFEAEQVREAMEYDRDRWDDYYRMIGFGGVPVTPMNCTPLEEARGVRIVNGSGFCLFDGIPMIPETEAGISGDGYFPIYVFTCPACGREGSIS